jgi:hypothetical protein
MTNREMVKDPHSVVEAASPAARVRAGPRGRPELFITAAGRMRASSEVERPVVSRALSSRLARLEGNSRGGETGAVVFPLRVDADRAAREADLTRSGLACASDCFLPIWQSASAESFAPYRVAGTMREFMDSIASHGRRIHGVA